jgi:hypothetical protein
VRPIFVGGSGRSGTTITGQLLGSHSQIWSTFPREVRFVTDSGGLLDLVLGTRTRIQHLDERLQPEELSESIKLRLAALVASKKNRADTNLAGFLRGMRGRWWLRSSPTGTPRGLHRGFDRGSFLEKVDAFEATYPRGAREAAARLVDRLLGEKAAAERATAFVDTTPPNAENAHRLLDIFPDAKILHLVRDCRDSAASVVKKSGAPTATFRRSSGGTTVRCGRTVRSPAALRRASSKSTWMRSSSTTATGNFNACSPS